MQCINVITAVRGALASAMLRKALQFQVRFDELPPMGTRVREVLRVEHCRAIQ